MALNLGMTDGKAVEKSVSVSGIGNDVTAEKILAVTSALAGLLEYPVTSVKKYDTGLLVE
jgi:hypothetical protein